LVSPLLEADIRLVLATTDKKQAKERLKELAGTFGVYTKSESNNFVLKTGLNGIVVFRKPYPGFLLYCNEKTN